MRLIKTVFRSPRRLSFGLQADCPMVSKQTEYMMSDQVIVDVDSLDTNLPIRFAEPPFSADVFSSSHGPVSEQTPGARQEIGPTSRQHKLILPAVYHDTKSKSNSPEEIHQHDESSVKNYLKWELDLSRLNKIHDYLWLAGRPASARALHRQIMIGRDITITEQADLHLIWQESRIYLKPMPEFLLDFDFWRSNLCGDEQLYPSACGFLLSYVWLVCHKSDLKIAHDRGLLPPEIKWENWVLFSKSLLRSINPKSLDGINHRYQYGELRLTRLNWIYRVFSRPWSSRTFIQGYMSGYNRYSVFVQRNFAWVLAAFVYVTIVLTAMQVGLATDRLGNDARFQRASYGFTVFSILAPIVAIGILAVTLSILFIFNLLVTLTTKNNTQRNRRTLSEQQKISETSP